MKVLHLAFLALCLAALTAGQTRTERREKLRKLIAAAKGGDNAAKTALRNLRNRLRSRSQNVGNPETFQQVDPQPVVNDPIPFNTEPQTPQQPRHFEPEIAPVPVQQNVAPQPIRNSFQSRRPRLRTLPQETGQRNFLGPHRALNRGLEVDTRSEANAFIRVTNETNTPPIQTIKRYSYFDEEGNYIFGYEAADGSFKEEKRGRNCIVNGKYGYVDPDGVKREFSYVSGNRCDPDAPVDHDLQGNEINPNPLPKNNQFLVQTEEKKLDPSTLNELQFNQRRPVQQNIQQSRPQPQPQRNRFRSRGRQQNRIESERRGNAINLRHEPIINNIPRQPAIQPKPIQSFPAPTESPIRISTFRPVQPIQITHKTPVFRAFKPTPKTFRPAQPNQITQRPPVFPAFRPTPQTFRPSQNFQNRFDFEEEFQNIFSNFNHNQPRPFTQPRPFPQPRPFSPPRTSAPIPPPTPRPTTSRPKTENPVPQHRAIFPTTVKPLGLAHQLVFDVASGGFKTVPLNNVATNSFNRAPSPSAPRPPPPPPSQSFFKSSPSVGKPLPLPGFNPLPSVPLGSLSFQSSNRATADFDKFFNHFNF